MFKKVFNKKVLGNIGLSIMGGITAITFAGVAMQMGYSSFKLKTEKQLHILNSVRFVTIVQIGIEEGWVPKPGSSSSETIYLSDVETNYDLSTTLKNPSLDSQNYNESSFIIVQNENGKLKFFVELIEENSSHKYIENEKEIHLLGIDDVTLNI